MINVDIGHAETGIRMLVAEARRMAGSYGHGLFNRYAIASPDDVRAALGRTQEYRATRKAGNNINEFPSESAGK